VDKAQERSSNFSDRREETCTLIDEQESFTRSPFTNCRRNLRKLQNGIFRTMKTRGASARQAAAQRRIQHIDTFSGSAPPFENMTDASDTPGWSMNPRKADERRYLENMIRYLHDDPTVYDNLEILRFIYKEWPIMENTLHTKTTMDTLKRRLLSMNVRYIHRGKDPGNWAYWRDYTDDGMLEYHTAPADMTPMQYPVREDKEQSTPNIKALDRNPHVTSVSRDDNEGTLSAFETNRETTKNALPDNVTPPPTQMDPMTATQILQTEPPDNGTPHATTKTTEEDLADDMTRMRPPDIMLDNVTLHYQFPPSTPLPQDNMQHTKHAEVQEPTTTVFNPYTGKRITVRTQPASSVDDMASSATLARNLLADLNDNDLVDMEDDTGTPDGFTPVPPATRKTTTKQPSKATTNTDTVTSPSRPLGSPNRDHASSQPPQRHKRPTYGWDTRTLTAGNGNIHRHPTRSPPGSFSSNGPQGTPAYAGH
jgi:hypothetical protein